VFNSLETATAEALILGYISEDPFDGGCSACDPSEPTLDDWPRETTAFIYWTVSANTNDILESGEHANLVVVFAASDRPEHLDKIRVELILAGGASLTVERAVPLIFNEVVDLG